MDKRTSQKVADIAKFEWEKKYGDTYTRATELRKWLDRDKGRMNEGELRRVLIFIYTEIHKDNYVVESLKEGLR